MDNQFLIDYKLDQSSENNFIIFARNEKGGGFEFDYRKNLILNKFYNNLIIR